MPRAFKAPRLKRNISATEKTHLNYRSFEKPQKAALFLQAGLAIHHLKASHLSGKARGGGEGEGIKTQTRPAVVIFIPQVPQDTLGFCSATQ